MIVKNFLSLHAVCCRAHASNSSRPMADKRCSEYVLIVLIIMVMFFYRNTLLNLCRFRYLYQKLGKVTLLCDLKDLATDTAKVREEG